MVWPHYWARALSTYGIPVAYPTSLMMFAKQEELAHKAIAAKTIVMQVTLLTVAPGLGGQREKGVRAGPRRRGRRRGWERIMEECIWRRARGCVQLGRGGPRRGFTALVRTKTVFESLKQVRIVEATRHGDGHETDRQVAAACEEASNLLGGG